MDDYLVDYNCFEDKKMLNSAVRRNDIGSLQALLLNLNTTTKERDAVGNTPLHLAVCMNNIAMVQLLAPKIPLHLQDFESGYTPLHKAFYLGHLKIAIHLLRTKKEFAEHLSIRDFEGFTVMDLFNASIPPVVQLNSCETFEALDEYDSHSDSESSLELGCKLAPEPCTSIWTWGSNANYTLCHQNSDDRNQPEQVQFEHVFEKFSLENYQLNIQHISMSKYHTCIIASHQLWICGFGSSGRLGIGHSQTTLKPTLVKGLQVQSVATGPDHTLAINMHGRVWSWGSNEYSQLGYPTTQNQNQNQNYEVSPKEITTVLRKVKVVGAWCSKFHSAVFSDLGFVFTWGTNNGQLGFETSVPVQTAPRKVTILPQQQITHIGCTNTSTAILNSSNEIFVLSDYHTLRVSIAFPQPSFGVFHRKSPKRSFVKLISGHFHYSIITNEGDVYLWVPLTKEFENSWEQKNLNQKKPRKIWTARNTNLCAVDVAIGLDSSVLICTKSGHVYYGKRRVKGGNESSFTEKESKLYKFSRIQTLEHISQVSANSAGAFAAIRKDYRSGFDLCFVDTFRQDIKTIVGSEDDLIEPIYTDVALKALGENYHWVHRSILSARSPACTGIFEKASVSPSQLECKLKSKNGKSFFEINLDSFHSECVKLLIEYLYSGFFRKTWDSSVLLCPKNDNNYDENGNPTKSKMYQDFKSLFNLFQLDDSEFIRFSCHSTSHLKDSFLPLLKDLQFADVKIMLLNNNHVLAHQPILSSRSKFFNALLKPQSQWTIQRDNQGFAKVDLNHVNPTTFQVILYWIYGETDLSTLFKTEKTLTRYEMIMFLIDILSVSNELLIDPLKELCSLILCSFLDLTNVFDLLQVANTFYSPKLAQSCVEFKSLILNGSLFDLKDEVMDMIQEKVKQLQSRALPFIKEFYEITKKNAIAYESDRKEKRRVEFEERQSRINHADQLSSLGGSSSTCWTSPVLKPLEIDLSDIGCGEKYESLKDENIFEMELDTPTKKQGAFTPVKSKKTWKKVNLCDSPSPSVTPTKHYETTSVTPTKQWISTSHERKHGFKDIMNSQLGRPPSQRKSPSISFQAVPNHSQSSPKHIASSPTTPVSQSPLFIGEPFYSVRIVNGKQSQRDRRRSSKMTSPTLPPQAPTSSSTPANAWSLSLSTSPNLVSEVSKSFKEIQLEESFKRQALQSNMARPSLLSSPAKSWAYTAKSSPPVDLKSSPPFKSPFKKDLK